MKLRADLLALLGHFDAADKALETLSADPDVADRTRSRVLAARDEVVQAFEALEVDQPEEAFARFTAALKVAPLSPMIRLARAGAALSIGDFDLALEDARSAHRLSGGGDALPSDTSAVEVLTTLGFALLSIGVDSAAMHNFHGCASLEEAAGRDATPCRKLAMAARVLGRESAAISAALQSEAWKSAAELADKMIETHGSGVEVKVRSDGRVTKRRPVGTAQEGYPQFERSFWGLHAASARCIARGALNVTEPSDVWEPCLLVVEAPEAMRARLDPVLVVRCHAALAEALERGGRLDDALPRAEAAEELLSTGGGDYESISAEVRLLRERLARAVRRKRADIELWKQQSSGAKNSTHKKAANHYETLELTRNATLPEIKSAYRRLALKWHPDKNSDPNAVPMFLDIQQAYQVLSDPDLRRRYDQGQDVDDDAGAKNMKPMQYKIVEIDRERGVAKVWWFDPNTGEEGFMEVDYDARKQDEAAADARGRTLREHCCLPRPATSGDSDS